MAVIDILQHYDAKKKAAHAAKTVKHGVRSRLEEPCPFKEAWQAEYPLNVICLRVPLQAGAEISTVNPEQYSKRFYDFITTILS